MFVIVSGEKSGASGKRKSRHHESHDRPLRTGDHLLILSTSSTHIWKGVGGNRYNTTAETYLSTQQRPAVRTPIQDRPHYRVPQLVPVDPAENCGTDTHSGPPTVQGTAARTCRPSRELRYGHPFRTAHSTGTAARTCRPSRELRYGYPFRTAHTTGYRSSYLSTQ